MTGFPRIIATIAISAAICIHGIPASQASAGKVRPEKKAVGAVEYGQKNSGAYLHFIIGYQAELNGDIAKAIKEYRRVLSLDPGASSVRMQLSEVLLKNGQAEEAVVELEKLLMQNPEDIRALMLIAQAENSRKNTSKAIETYERVLDLEPDNDSARLHMSMLLAGEEMFDRAWDVLKKVEDDEVAASAFYYIGIIASGTNNLKEAEKAFKRSLHLDPEIESSYHYLGIIAAEQGKVRKAEGYYKKALEINPGNIGILQSLSQLYLDNKKLEEAIEVEKRIESLAPGHIDTNRKLGLIFMNLNRFDEAISEFRKVVTGEPKDKEFRYYLALALEEAGRLEEAAAEYGTLSEMEPGNVKALLNLGYIYATLNKVEKAAEAYEKLIRISGDNAEYYVYLARLYMRLEKMADAKRVLEEGLGIFDQHAELHFTMAVYCEHEGEFDLMVKHLKKAIELDPMHADAMNFLGYSYAEKNMNLEEALMLVENSLALKPGNGYITDSLGWIYFKMGKYDKALKTLIKASDIISNDPVILDHLGDAYLVNENKKKAMDAWKRALEAEDMEKDLQESLERKLNKLKQEQGR